MRTVGLGQAKSGEKQGGRFSRVPLDGIRHKKLGGHEHGPKNWHFSFHTGPAGDALLQADWALGSRQAMGIHTGAGGQCTDAIEAGISADRPECIHTGTVSGGLG